MRRSMREAAQRLVKGSRHLRDTSEVLLREAEAALHALRETMRQSPNRGMSRRSGSWSPPSPSYERGARASGSR